MSGLTRILWRWTDWHPVLSALQRGHFSVWVSCNRITECQSFFRTSLPKSRCVGVPSRLIVSPLVVLLVIARVEPFQRLRRESLVVSRRFDTKMGLIISNSGGCHQTEYLSKRWISHQFWCCPCRTCPQVFRDFDSDFIAFVVNVWNLDFSLFFIIDW